MDLIFFGCLFLFLGFYRKKFPDHQDKNKRRYIGIVEEHNMNNEIYWNKRNRLTSDYLIALGPTCIVIGIITLVFSSKLYIGEFLIPASAMLLLYLIKRKLP